LRKIAAALLAKAAGDMTAINSLADRTDGKVAQALIGDSEEDPVRVHHTMVRKVVEPDAK
jgi:transcription elongation GreA/GreB family factor